VWEQLTEGLAWLDDADAGEDYMPASSSISEAKERLGSEALRLLFEHAAGPLAGAGVHYVTIINKTQGSGAADAAITIVPPGPGWRGAEIMTLSGGEPGDATGASATLGGAAITGDTPWDGTWNALSADQRAGIHVTVRATTAAIARIHSGG
jgi:hypothetical protein